MFFDASSDEDESEQAIAEREKRKARELENRRKRAYEKTAMSEKPNDVEPPKRDSNTVRRVRLADALEWELVTIGDDDKREKYTKNKMKIVRLFNGDEEQFEEEIRKSPDLESLKKFVITRLVDTHNDRNDEENTQLMALLSEFNDSYLKALLKVMNHKYDSKQLLEILKGPNKFFDEVWTRANTVLVGRKRDKFSDFVELFSNARAEEEERKAAEDAISSILTSSLNLDECPVDTDELVKDLANLQLNFNKPESRTRDTSPIPLSKAVSKTTVKMLKKGMRHLFVTADEHEQEDGTESDESSESSAEEIWPSDVSSDEDDDDDDEETARWKSIVKMMKKTKIMPPRVYPEDFVNMETGDYGATTSTVREHENHGDERDEMSPMDQEEAQPEAMEVGYSEEQDSRMAYELQHEQQQQQQQEQHHPVINNGQQKQHQHPHCCIALAPLDSVPRFPDPLEFENFEQVESKPVYDEPMEVEDAEQQNQSAGMHTVKQETILEVEESTEARPDEPVARAGLLEPKIELIENEPIGELQEAQPMRVKVENDDEEEEERESESGPEQLITSSPEQLIASSPEDEEAVSEPRVDEAIFEPEGHEEIWDQEIDEAILDEGVDEAVSDPDGREETSDQEIDEAILDGAIDEPMLNPEPAVLRSRFDPSLLEPEPQRMAPVSIPEPIMLSANLKKDKSGPVVAEPAIERVKLEDDKESINKIKGKKRVRFVEFDSHLNKMRLFCGHLEWFLTRGDPGGTFAYMDGSLAEMWHFLHRRYQSNRISVLRNGTATFGGRKGNDVPSFTDFSKIGALRMSANGYLSSRFYFYRDSVLIEESLRPDQRKAAFRKGLVDYYTQEEMIDTFGHDLKRLALAFRSFYGREALRKYDYHHTHINYTSRHLLNQHVNNRLRMTHGNRNISQREVEAMRARTFDVLKTTRDYHDVASVWIFTDWRLAMLKEHSMLNAKISVVPTQLGNLCFYKMKQMMKVIFEEDYLEVKTLIFAFGGHESFSIGTVRKFLVYVYKLTASKNVNIFWYNTDFEQVEEEYPCKSFLPYEDFQIHRGLFNQNIEDFVNEMQMRGIKNVHYLHGDSENSNLSIETKYLFYLKCFEKYCGVLLSPMFFKSKTRTYADYMEDYSI